MRIGLFGGTFDPPHVAHLAIAEAACSVALLDRVIWVPAADPPLKPSAPVASAADRLAMTQLAIEGNDRFEVSGVEIERGGTSFTIDTLRQVSSEHPDDELFLIVGGDSLRSFLDWRDPFKILDLATLVIYGREVDHLDDVDKRLRESVIMIRERPLLDMSSTKIREMIAAGKSIRYVVPDRVADYIRANRLYRSEHEAR